MDHEIVRTRLRVLVKQVLRHGYPADKPHQATLTRAAGDRLRRGRRLSHRPRPGLLFTAVILCVGPPAWAVPVTFGFVAEVTAVSDSSSFPCTRDPLSPCEASSGLHVSDLIAGSFSYEPEATGGLSSTGAVVYSLSGPPTGATLAVGSGYAFDALYVEVGNDLASFETPDWLTIQTPFLTPQGQEAREWMTLEFLAIDPQAMSSSSLPAEPLDLYLFEARRGKLSIIVGNRLYRDQLDFRIASLAIPEPGTGALVVWGLGLLARLRTRLRRHGRL